jgi:radical SAM superfamily enzyme YgiQ (UPF0313 family)
MSEPVRLKVVAGEFPPLRARDTSRPIMLVGFQELENLGIGYLAATLRSQGYRVDVFDFERDPQQILEAAQKGQPLLIGFSLIFQFYVHRFAALIRTLRSHGVTCHFTIGGHFPSLSFQHTLQLLPGLDSVVRFEGELTLLELADCLSTGREWRNVDGIAYTHDNKVVTTPLRRLIEDLDQLPYPERDFKDHTAFLGRRSTLILASRGCIRTCSFCSIHMFYRSAPGRVVRTRKPAKVVAEMRHLYEKHGISIFMFQDDDFPVYGPAWRRWALEFVDELHRNRLPGHVLWKINCRADAVERELFAAMRDAGLYLVYMGLESGNEEGMKSLHKQITVEENLLAVKVLKELKLRFEFGFMLFEPSTTFESVRQDLQFLRNVVGDGATAASFCRMVPYDGTPIKEELLKSGRLRGDVTNPDYEFLDARVGEFCNALGQLLQLTGWVHGLDAVSPQLNFALSELAVIERLFPSLNDLPSYKEELRKLTRASNELLFGIVESMADTYANGTAHEWSPASLRRACQGFVKGLLEIRNGFIARHQGKLLHALHEEAQWRASYKQSAASYP